MTEKPKEFKNKKQEYYWEHRDEILAKQRVRQREAWKKDPEKQKLYHKRWKERHPGADYACRQKWRAKHIDKDRAKCLVD